ncbi:SAM-dependent methyltransferase [Celeribacter sp.]|uniref:SAM-dependent methyltransferase n=1 Tax=Celeribacter sp. TaxID=1890673 RepID=UPI003A8F0F1A
MTQADLRPGEMTGPVPDRSDASLLFIGTLHTPWTTPRDCPKRGDAETGPLCRAELDPIWQEALKGVTPGPVQLLYWMHLGRRDLRQQSPRNDGQTIGTFAIRSPMRPNLIASSIVQLERIEGTTLWLRGLNCVDGTPLLDIKPSHGVLK